jgi:hypothetical protein
MNSAPAVEQLPTLSFDYVKAARVSRGLLASLGEDEIRALAHRYRRFLALKSRYPDLAIAPTEILDEMWHLHMLHPRAYHRDCMEAFGSIMDHAPGFGASPGEERALARTFARTSALYEREFGEPYSVPGQPFQNVIICADEAEEDEEEELEEEGTPAEPVEADASGLRHLVNA